MRLISYPFRLSPNGSAATVEDGSDDATAELLAVLVLTRRGERDLVPDFGVPDPAFGTLDLNDVAASVAMFGPEVSLEAVRVSYPTPTTQEVDISYA